MQKGDYSINLTIRNYGWEEGKRKKESNKIRKRGRRRNIAQ